MTDQKPITQDDLREIADVLETDSHYSGSDESKRRAGYAAKLREHAAAMDAAKPVALIDKDALPITNHCLVYAPSRTDLLFQVRLYTHPAPPASEVVEAWQPIETAPKDGTLIVALWDNRERINSRNCSTIYWDGDWIFNNRRITAPTHWRPIPANLTGATND